MYIHTVCILFIVYKVYLKESDDLDWENVSLLLNEMNIVFTNHFNDLKSVLVEINNENDNNSNCHNNNSLGNCKNGNENHGSVEVKNNVKFIVNSNALKLLNEILDSMELLSLRYSLAVYTIFISI